MVLTVFSVQPVTCCFVSLESAADSGACAGATNSSCPWVQPNRTPHNQQQTFVTLFHRNIMTVSETPVNKHDVVSNIPLSGEVYQVSLAPVNFQKFLRPTTNPMGRPNPWITLN